MSLELYYTPPPQPIFDEVKAKAIALWKTIGDERYQEEKLVRCNIENVGDNFMYLIAMFDTHNMFKLAQSLSKEACEAIVLRLDGTPLYKNLFSLFII